MKHLHIILILLFAFSCASSEEGAANNGETTESQTQSTQVDPAALLAKAEETFFGLDNYHCTLLVEMPAGSATQTLKGLVWFSGNKHHIDFPEDLMICDGKETMTWYKEFGEVLVNPYEEETDMSLGGIYRLHKRPHSIKYIGTKDGLHQIELKESDPEAVFPDKQVFVDEKSHLIEAYHLVSPKMGTYKYQVSGVQTNQNGLPANMFVIDQDFVEKARNGEFKTEEHEHGIGTGHP